MTTQHPALDLHASPPAASRRPLRLRAGIWPWVPALLLVSLLGTQLAVLSSALDDPAFATEPDYYRKALDWDTQQARARASQALGWTASASADGATHALHAARTVSVSIADAHGAPVSGAAVRATAFPNARAARARQLTFREISAGVYRAELGVARPGVWELRCSATRGQERFESTLRFELDAAGVEP
jgi:nitrogen fixation protein FixH